MNDASFLLKVVEANTIGQCSVRAGKGEKATAKRLVKRGLLVEMSAQFIPSADGWRCSRLMNALVNEWA